MALFTASIFLPTAKEHGKEEPRHIPLPSAYKLTQCFFLSVEKKERYEQCSGVTYGSFTQRCSGLTHGCCACHRNERSVPVLAEIIALRSWARHFTLTVPLSAEVYKWVPGNLMLWVNLHHMD